jgi:hypothetical protein
MTTLMQFLRGGKLVKKDASGEQIAGSWVHKL